MRIVQVWTLKRGSLTPSEPLEADHALFVERCWYEQDHPDQGRRLTVLEALNGYRRRNKDTERIIRA